MNSRHSDPAMKSTTERAFEAFERMRARDYGLVLPLVLSLAILSCTVAGFFDPPSLSKVSLADHTEAYRRNAEEGEDQRCRTEKHRNSPARQNVHGSDDDRDEAEQENTTLCLTRLALRESIVANEIAVRYNAISAEAAWWSRLGGILVTVLGIVSVIGIIVAVFAASDARRAIDLGMMSVAVARRSSRAYLHLRVSGFGVGPLLIRNEGSTPAAIFAIWVAFPNHDIAELDVSVMDWSEHVARYDLIGPSAEVPVILPFIGYENPHGTLIGIAFVDVHGDRWCSWQHRLLDAETGVVLFGRTGEFPL